MITIRNSITLLMTLATVLACFRTATAQSPTVESFRLDLSIDEIRLGQAKQTRALASQAYLYQVPAFLQMRQVPEFLHGREMQSPGETPLGGWILVRSLSTPETDNTLPNVDTLYGASYVWLDKQGPVVLTIPSVKRRYHSVVLHDTYFNCFAVLSKRTVGDDGGHYLLVPPGWKGEKPDGINRVIVAPTPIVALYQRVYLGQGEDGSEVQKIQDRITLSPFVKRGKLETKFPVVDDEALRVARLRELSDPLEFFERINAYTALTPPPESDSRLVELFKTVGLGPGNTLPKEQHLLDAIKEGVVDAQEVLNARISSGPFKQGWRVPAPKTAQADQDILERAAVQITQIGSLPNEEAMYYVGTRDSADSLLDGDNQYRLTFERGKLPPIGDGAFWSLTMYNEKALLVDNPINRYLIRPDTPGLTFGPDGSLTLNLQKDEPKESPKANWLPAPKGNFVVVLRAYWPKKEMLDGIWFPPAIEKIGNKAKPPVAQPEIPVQQKSLQPLAYSTAVQAFLYAHAPIGMYQRFSDEVLNPETRKFGVDVFHHFSELSTPEKAPFRAPNNDTLYSTAWLDVRTEPVILAAPDTAGRYWTAQVMDFDSNTLTNFGARLDSTKASEFAVVGPSWQGELPQGVSRSVKCPTGFALVLLRVLVDGPDDVAAASKLQSQFTLASLSKHAVGGTGPSSDAIDGVPILRANSSSDRLAALDFLLNLNPTRVGEESILTQFALIGVGSKKSPLSTKPSEAVLARAEADALKAIEAAGPRIGKFANGWLVMSENIGAYGFDYLQRSSIWAGGPLANFPEESLYPSAITDVDGIPLDGSTGRYKLHFPAGQLPPVEFFWSLTMYDRNTGMLVKNSMNRYSLGNRTRGMEFERDGALSIYIQHESPGKDKESNWLPAPSGPFYLSMRLYGPKISALNGEWKVPPLLPIK